MRICFLIASIAVSFHASAQLFTSGFESWSASGPAGWFQAGSTFDVSEVVQVSDAHSGASAARFTNTSVTSKSITSTSFAINVGTSYVVSYWAKGQGSVRPILFGSTTWGGNAFDEVNTTEWQQFTRVIPTFGTASPAGVRLSVNSTVGPEHVIIDDLSVTVFVFVPPPFHTIQELQQPSGSDGFSVFLDSLVTTTGIVTGITREPFDPAYYLQNGTGPYSGIYVRGTTTGLTLGDEVTVSGSVYEEDQGNGTETTLINLVAREVISSGNPDPSPEVLTISQADAEQWESVLVRMENLEPEWSVSTGTWQAWEVITVGIVFGTQLYEGYPYQTGSIYHVSGVYHRSYAEWLYPRKAEDTEEVVGVQERSLAAVRVYPNPASDQLTIDFGPVSAPITYELRDLQGRLVSAEQGVVAPVELDVAGLASGAYCLSVQGYKPVMVVLE
jgi:hypothetical protein